jgi:riboflavin kinase/FMN adenylyltransferase
MPVLFRHLDHLPKRFRGCALAIGNFDGVHVGHARIVARLRAMAQRVGGPAVILTFDPHPARLLRPDEAPAPLCWTERKADLLGQLGAGAVVAYPTDRSFLEMEARTFFDRVVRDHLDGHGLVEGRNFFFGRHRDGTVAALQGFCDEAGIPLDVVEPAEIDGRVVSSSLVRGQISAGDVQQARRLLGRPHRIRGTVVHGRGRGNRLGYPTANVERIDILAPAEGIYAGRALLAGKSYPAALSLGANPTFGESDRKVEAFLLDYAGDLYDRTIEIDFLARLRDIKKFHTAEELVAQMAQDVEQTRQIAATPEGQ